MIDFIVFFNLFGEFDPFEYWDADYSCVFVAQNFIKFLEMSKTQFLNDTQEGGFLSRRAFN